ncbi:MAG: twin-arginine translocase subunit TatC [Planctomycetes bacterium]|nr:twin-arginine translocase subunit TatC [Planctomycetota bacterium]
MPEPSPSTPPSLPASAEATTGVSAGPPAPAPSPPLFPSSSPAPQLPPSPPAAAGSPLLPAGASTLGAGDGVPAGAGAVTGEAAGGPPEDRRLSFGEHLEELRSHVLRGLYGFALAILLSLACQDALMALATRPHRVTMQRLEREAHPDAPLSPSIYKLKVLEYPESIMAHIKLSLIAATFLSSPWIFYQLWAFVAVGLYVHERKYVFLFAPLTFGLFCVGILFGYFGLIPFGLYYLASFGSEVVEASFTLSNYLDFFLTLTLVVGLMFELPLVMLFSAKIGLGSAASFRGHWRAAILVAFVVAAVATPGPDPVSQCLLAGPLIGLYFFGILLCSWFARRDAASALAPSDPAQPE